MHVGGIEIGRDVDGMAVFAKVDGVYFHECGLGAVGFTTVVW